MTGHRDRAEVCRDALVALEERGPMRMSNIMSYANVTYDKVRCIIERLVTQGFVVKKPGRFYEITARGIVFQREITKLYDFLDADMS